MSDKILLELAAKAAGVPLHQLVNRYDCWEETPILIGRAWSPLTDDGDCARLEAALGIEVQWYPMGAVAISKDGDERFREPYADHAGDKAKARRYASTRAAAIIGQPPQGNPL